jgi:hypothetical protein
VTYKLIAFEFLPGLFCALAALAGPAETPWEAVRHLPKHHVYTVLDRGGACVTGAFVSASGNEITLALPQQRQRSLYRSGILRISLGETADIHFAVYSARSSWSDLQALPQPPSSSDVMVVTSDNREFQGPLMGVSSDQLSLFVDGHEMRFAKEYVDRALLIGANPASEPPGSHRSLIKLPKKASSSMQPIPLYDVNAHEDNSQVDCLPAYRRQ